MTKNRSPRCQLILVSMLAVLALGGCADELQREQRAESAQRAGSLTIPLIAYGGSYRFRLVDAAFEIKGPTNALLVAAPDADFAESPPLVAGGYVVRLLDGWRLQRETGQGFLEVDARSLWNQASAYVENGRASSISFRFQTFGQIVETGQGTIQINVEVELTEAVNPWTAVKVAVGPNHACAVADDQTLRCWGEGGNGKLGYGDTRSRRIDEASPVDVGGRVTDLALGDNHTCVVLEGGLVRCWGSSYQGQLGYGNTNLVGDDEVPAAVGDVDIGGSVVQISAGYDHTCALLEGGRVRCWGVGGNGALGYGNPDSVGAEQTPAQVGDVDVQQIAEVRAGGAHTCARDFAGQVRCWGYIDGAQIGDDEPASAAVVHGFIAPATQLVVAAGHFCVVLANDEVACGGFGGDAYVSQFYLSGGFLGGSVQKLGASFAHNCALLSSGDVRCWGFNYGGILGSSFPEAVMASDALLVPLAAPVRDLAVGNTSCAIDAEGKVRCWPPRPLL